MLVRSAADRGMLATPVVGPAHEGGEIMLRGILIIALMVAVVAGLIAVFGEEKALDEGVVVETVEMVEPAAPPAAPTAP